MAPDESDVTLWLSKTTWLYGITIVFVAYFWYNAIVNHYWKRRNVPCDHPLQSFIFFSTFISQSKTFFQIYQEQYKKHGRIAGLYIGRHPLLLLSEPELIRQALVKDSHFFPEKRKFPGDTFLEKMLLFADAKNWRRTRSIVAPAFNSNKMRKVALLINKSAERIANVLVKYADSGKVLDVKKMYGAFSMDVIASSVFGTDIDSLSDPNNIFVTNAVKLFRAGAEWRHFIQAASPKLKSLLKINLFDPEASEFFQKLILQKREERLREEKSCEDLLQLLMDAEAETDEDGPIKIMSKKTLSPEELVAQCTQFFLAGFETIATSLSFLSLLLALNPECQKILQKEVDETWESEGMIDMDIVHSMPYLEATISESLRLYPVAPIINRWCAQDYQLPGTNITVPKGVQMDIPVYAMHHDPEFFPDPESFKPERFLPENKESIKPYTYMPFGVGPRFCAVMRLALLEMKICIAHVMRKVSFRVCPDTKIPTDFYTRVTMMRPKEVTLKVERR